MGFRGGYLAIVAQLAGICTPTCATIHCKAWWGFDMYSLSCLPEIACHTQDLHLDEMFRQTATHTHFRQWHCPADLFKLSLPAVCQMYSRTLSCTQLQVLPNFDS